MYILSAIEIVNSENIEQDNQINLFNYCMVIGS